MRGDTNPNMDTTALAKLLALAAADPRAFEALLEQAKLSPSAGPPGPPILLSEVFEKYDLYAREAIPSWLHVRQSIWTPLTSFFAARPWTELSPQLVREYTSLRRAQGIAPSTRNKEVAHLKAIVSWAIEEQVIPTKENPIASVKREPVRNDRNFHIGEDDFQRLLSHCRPLLRSMLILAFETGMRRDEFRKLEWSEVDLKHGFITLAPSRHKAGRTGRSRIIPLSSVALAVLERQGRSGKYVFPGPTGQPVTRPTLGSWFRRARSQAGVRGPKGQQVWIHTMRKSFGSLAALGGMEIGTAMDIAGWADKRTADQYRSMSQRHIQTAREQLDARLKEPQRLLEALDGSADDDR